MRTGKKTGLAAALLALLLLGTAALAEVSGINIMSVIPVENAPQMYFEVRAQDSTGSGVRVQQQDYHFSAGSEGIELKAEPVAGSQGHIVVVDTSKYYYGNEVIKIDNIRDIVTAYLSRLSSDERVMFVLASEANQPTCTKYMPLESAREYARGLSFGKENSAKINTAIYAAFQCAINPEKDAPMSNTVFIVADPDLASNSSDERSMGECVQLRANSSRNFDVAVAILYREQFLKGTGDTRRKELNEGFAKFEDFAVQCGGKYIQIPQDDKGVATDDLHVKLSSWLYTTNCFLVDFSPLSGHLPTEPQLQNVSVSVACRDAGGNAVRSVDVALDTALLPPPAVTPEPIPLEPTPTPAPTPVVVVGQEDHVAVQAIHALIQMNYLTKSNVKEFDNNCFMAYIDFCQNNGIDPRDGIYQETYDLMLSGEAIAKAVATPEPTATPIPTIPPQGFALNDQDTEHSGSYIAQMQAILKKLNCYEEGVSSNAGRFDQATLDAVKVYCQAYNWNNDHPNGVSKSVCEEILKDPDLSPVVKAEPTLQEKAKAFMAGSTMIAQYAVPNVALVGVCFALVIAIFLIVILRKPSKPEEPEKQVKEEPKSNSVPPVKNDRDMDSGNPFGDEDSTVAAYAYKYIKLEVRYGGNSSEVEISMKDNEEYAIGRKDTRNNIPDPDLILDAADKRVSRGKHAVLRYKNGNVYIHDNSSYHDTTVNGMPAFSREGRDGLMIESGDEIGLGMHMITVRF